MRLWTRKVHEIDPDEIFLDSSNLPGHNAFQFEGRLGRPVSGRAILSVGIIFLLVVIIFSARAFILEVARGSTYVNISRNNTLDRSLLFATRGIIYDRTGRELVWNVAQLSATATSSNSAGSSLYALRQYINEPGFAHLLGFVRYPKADARGAWWKASYSGVEGVELEYDARLSGINGATLVETNAHGKVQATNMVSPPRDGENLHLSVDTEVQRALYKALVAQGKAQGFRAGAGIIMNVKTGEVLAITSFPEYDNQAFTNGDTESINTASNAPLSPLLDRAVSGLYAPGSIMKTIFAAAALNEHLISPAKQIFSTGAISVANPYDPKKPTLFHDWAVHGWIDMRTALAVSSDEYFYTIGGGYGNQDGLGIAKVD